MSLRHGRFAGYGKIEADFRAGIIQAKLIRNAIGRAPQLPRLGNCDMDIPTAFCFKRRIWVGRLHAEVFDEGISEFRNFFFSLLERVVFFAFEEIGHHEESVEGSFGAEQLVTHIACGIARGERTILQTFGLGVVHEVEKEQVRVSRRTNEASIWPLGRPLDR